jgi:hypothetical protein
MDKTHRRIGEVRGRSMLPFRSSIATSWRALTRFSRRLQHPERLGARYPVGAKDEESYGCSLDYLSGIRLLSGKRVLSTTDPSSLERQRRQVTAREPRATLRYKSRRTARLSGADVEGDVVVRYLVAVPIEGADPFVMEIDGNVDGGVVRSARPGEVVATVTQSFDAALERLRPMIQAILAKVRDTAEGPEQIAVEFGLKMSMEAGLIVAHATSEANFKVTLQWKRA